MSVAIGRMDLELVAYNYNVERCMSLCHLNTMTQTNEIYLMHVCPRDAHLYVTWLTSVCHVANTHSSCGRVP